MPRPSSRAAPVMSAGSLAAFRGSAPTQEGPHDARGEQQAHRARATTTRLPLGTSAGQRGDHVLARGGDRRATAASAAERIPKGAMTASAALTRTVQPGSPPCFTMGRPPGAAMPRGPDPAATDRGRLRWRAPRGASRACPRRRRSGRAPCWRRAPTANAGPASNTTSSSAITTIIESTATWAVVSEVQRDHRDLGRGRRVLDDLTREHEHALGVQRADGLPRDAGRRIDEPLGGDGLRDPKASGQADDANESHARSLTPPSRPPGGGCRPRGHSRSPTSKPAVRQPTGDDDLVRPRGS